MTVILSQTPMGEWDRWVVLDGPDHGLPPHQRCPDLGSSLERAFDSIADDWWDLGRRLGSESSARLSHAPAAVANASDLGLMMAWTKLVAEWAESSTQVLVLTRDPWLFRHLAALPGVQAGKKPSILKRSLGLWLRGYAARTLAALRVAKAALVLKHHRASSSKGGAYLLVYGHPASTPEGHDAYFGSCLTEVPDLSRLLHADCSAARAVELAQGGRTRSIHAWGNPLHALFRLPLARWSPTAGRENWLVRRAAALEGGTGQAAMIAWQIHCQDRWLDQVRPDLVAWPWENHSWERCFVRSARRLGIQTVGYQHSVVGRQMLNYAARSNFDPQASLPDRVLCSGAATAKQIMDWGMPESRISIGGGLRFPRPITITPAPLAPIFLALPFDQSVAAEMVEAARAATAHGWRFVVRDHPMTPYAFTPQPGLEPATGPLSDYSELAGVVYAATTVGLEALLAGLPVLRFRSRTRIAIDILPAGISVPTTDAEHLPESLAALTPPERLDREWIFGTPDMEKWRRILQLNRPLAG